MWRLVAVLLSFAFVISACGGDNDDEGGASGDTSVAASASEGDDSGDAADPAESAAADDTSDEAMDDGDSGATTSVSGIDDVPQVCRDLMEQFLKDIEPIVSPIDWENATLNDFEAIAPQFDQIATNFDEATDAQEQCDNLDIDEEENFDLIIEFAGQVAPGTVGFMTFISEFANAAGATLAEDDASEDIGGGTGAFDDCEGAIAWMEELMAEYDSIADAPVAEVMQFAELGSFITTCTPAQLEYFDSADVQEFLSGF